MRTVIVVLFAVMLGSTVTAFWSTFLDLRGVLGLSVGACLGILTGAGCLILYEGADE